VATAVAAGDLPVLTSSRLSAPGALQGSGTEASLSQALDDQLRELVHQALAVYLVDESVLAAARPDIVLTQDLCEVCAVSYGETCRAVSHLAGHDVKVLSGAPTSLTGIWDDFRSIGAAIGRGAVAAELLDLFQSRLDEISAHAERAWRGSAAQRPPQVFTLEWIEPVMPGGLWMPELVSLAGGQALGKPGSGKTHAMDRAEVEALAPDVLIVQPCGLTLPQVIVELPALKRVLPWDQWPCCQQGRVYLCDGSAYFNRPGPRIVDSVELLAACIHPEEFADLRPRFSGAAAEVSSTGEVQLW
jgi:iron complex transport system substrate-binding protein